MKIIQETSTEVIYQAYFGECPVRFLLDKRTGEIRISADDAMKALGRKETFESYLGTDEGLDFLSDWKRENPGKPFWGGAVTRKDLNTH